MFENNPNLKAFALDALYDRHNEYGGYVRGSSESDGANLGTKGWIGIRINKGLMDFL